MVPIQFVPDPPHGRGTLANVPVFPGEYFQMNIPEAIGDTEQPCFVHNTSVAWTDSGNGVWTCSGHFPGELDYVLTVTPGFDSVDVAITVTNRSARIWSHSLAFNCFSSQGAPSVADYECARHWCRVGDRFRRLTRLPRVFSARPTLQIYTARNAPRVNDIRYADNFQATPEVVLEGWLAIRSRDGNRLVAAASDPALFLFQNMEFSCIHSAAGFGRLAPYETGQALTRIYLVQGTLEDWHARMRAELGL